MHGSGGPRSKGGRPVIHGKYSARFKQERPEVQATIDRLLTDPELMDARRPLALQAMLIEQAPMVPSDELIESLARREVRWELQKKRMDDGEEPVTDAEKMLALRRYLRTSQDSVDAYQRAQVAAHRAVKVGELLTQELLPIFDDIGRQTQRIFDRYVPEGEQEDAIKAFRNMMRHNILRVSTIGEDK
jgi:hypothetical protein